MKKVSLSLAGIAVFVFTMFFMHAGAFGEDYKVAPADVLEISVYGEDALARDGLVVRPDGKISFPLIGDLKASGHSTEELKEIVEEKVGHLIPEAQASVIVTRLGSLQYYIVGKVRNPGMYNVSRPLTVLQLLALAGGPLTFAREKSISIVRNYGKACTSLHFNYHEVKNGRHLEQDIFLKRGDVVVVP